MLAEDCVDVGVVGVFAGRDGDGAVRKVAERNCSGDGERGRVDEDDGGGVLLADDEQSALFRGLEGYGGDFSANGDFLSDGRFVAPVVACKDENRFGDLAEEREASALGVEGELIGVVVEFGFDEGGRRGVLRLRRRGFDRLFGGPWRGRGRLSRGDGNCRSGWGRHGGRWLCDGRSRRVSGRAGSGLADEEPHDSQQGTAGN